MVINDIRKWISILAVIMTVMQQLQAACVCNEKGTDGCATCTGVKVVRPKKPDRARDVVLPPIGDSCWCSKTMIEPAVLPKTCSEPKPKPPCSCAAPAPPPCSIPAASYVPKDDSLPADPISISLAIQAGKAIEVPEAKLAYGFMQKPLNGLPRVYISTIKEENLYALNSDVITLKKPSALRARHEEEDYPEPEEDEEPAVEPDDIPSLTYKQLGYETEQFKNPQFLQLPSFKFAARRVPVTVSADCGFVPGRIAKNCNRIY